MFFVFQAKFNSVGTFYSNALFNALYTMNTSSSKPCSEAEQSALWSRGIRGGSICHIQMWQKSLTLRHHILSLSLVIFKTPTTTTNIQAEHNKPHHILWLYWHLSNYSLIFINHFSGSGTWWIRSNLIISRLISYWFCSYS